MLLQSVIKNLFKNLLLQPIFQNFKEIKCNYNSLKVHNKELGLQMGGIAREKKGNLVGKIRISNLKKLNCLK